MRTKLTTGLCLREKTLYFLYKIDSKGNPAPYPCTFTLRHIRKMNAEGNFLKKNDNFEKVIKRDKILFTANHNRWWR